MRPFFFGPRQITLEANGSHRHLCHVTGFFSHSCIGVIKQETNADNRDVFYLFDVLSNKGIF
jgi:predicted transcriptional regulator